MAIGRISGQMLKANLLRSGTDLAFETNLLVLDVTNSRIGIGTASPAVQLHVNGTGAIRLPSGNDSQRPGSPANGDIRYNSEQSRIEGFSNGAWANMASGSKIQDQDGNTGVDVERSSDQNEIHFFTESSGDVGHIRDNGDFEIAGFDFSSGTIATTTTNGNITLTPNGTGAVAVSSNLTVTGNLTVNGTTTTIDSVTLTIEDPLLELAKNNSGGDANSFDQGLLMNRGSLDNVSMLWDESADQFAFAVTSGEDGTTAGNVTIDSYANLRAGDITCVDIDGILGSNTPAAATVTTLNTSGAVTFNDAGAAVDFRVEGDSDTDLFVIDGSADQIGISTAAGSIGYVLDASGSTDAFRLPIGDTSERPTAATGIIRFNSQTGKYEGCQDGSTYTEFATAGDTPIISKVSATGDGSTTIFTGFFSTAPASVANVLVFIDNVYQEPTENYTVSSTNITFTSAPHSGARIFAIVGFDNTALASGGVVRTETSAVNFTSSATTIMSFNATSYRAAEAFIITSDSSNTEYEVAKANIVHDGTTAYVTVYGLTSTSGTDLSTYTVTLSGGSVLLQAVSAGGTQSAKVQYSLSAV
jgi:hypothetical protein